MKKHLIFLFSTTLIGQTGFWGFGFVFEFMIGFVFGFMVGFVFESAFSFMFEFVFES